MATAFFAATIALTQTDLKRILAYSTISQLGFMFLAVGVGAYAAAIFHLITHAFFKALLFLGAGSVMHALHGELDIRKMGNLREKLPTTYWTFLIGAAALAGIPLLSGFFSKDEILWSRLASHRSRCGPSASVTAFLTAIYSFRVVFVPFWGQERDKKLFSHAHESPRVMTIPLIILAIGAVVAGYLGFPHLSLIERWLEPVFARRGEHRRSSPPASRSSGCLLAVSGLVAIGGAYLAYRAYVGRHEICRSASASVAGLVRQLVDNKYYVDEAYNMMIVQPLRALAALVRRHVRQAAASTAR